MSLTSILEQHSATAGSVFLTPRKRKKTSVQETQSQSQSTVPAPSNADIFRWVLTSDAIATCFVRDVFQMRHHQDKVEEFFWLKRVPCRTVRLLGLVVGVEVREKKLVYSVDDGTSVIDCIHRYSPPPQSPSKKLQQKKTTFGELLPKPVAFTGHTVRLTGKVVAYFESRQVVVNNIECCTSANDQPLHWRNVLNLHKSYYSSIEPFTIPAPSSTMPAPAPSAALEPVSFASSSTPSSHYSLHSSSSTSVATSPAKSTASSLQSPRKLRHPSRLHSRDLTTNSFRIYVKDFMDNYSSFATSDYTDDEVDDSEYEVPATPTKIPKRLRLDPDDENTPRPSRVLRSIQPQSSQLPSSRRPPQPSTDTTDPQLRGFTMSFLRRVPELSKMAQRVVRAEGKRRAREAKKKAKEAAASQRKGTSQSSKSLSLPMSNASAKPEPSTSVRMKRLWRMTLIELTKEGSIVLYDGPSHPIWMATEASVSQNAWRERSMASMSMNRSGMTEGSSLFSTKEEELEEIVISDEEAGEEVYVPLTPQFLAVEVERQIVHWRGKNGEGPTVKRLLAVFKNHGEWMHIGQWQVEAALDVLKTEGRAWVDQKGEWALVL